MDNEIYEVLENFSNALKALMTRMDAIEKAVMDELINPIKDEYEKVQYENALSDFRCKYGEKLEGYNDKLKALEGEDFDIVKQAFDDFNERKDGMEADEYVEKLSEAVENQLDDIAKAFGVEKEEIKEVAIETNDGEEVKAEVEDGEVKATEEAKVEVEPEAKASETDVSEAKASETDVELSEEEKDEKEWEEIAKSLKK